MKEQGSFLEAPTHVAKPITRRQAIAFGLAVLGLGNAAVMRVENQKIEGEVEEAHRMVQQDPTIPDSYPKDMEVRLQEEAHFPERTKVTTAALVLSGSLLFYDSHFTKKSPLKDQNIE